MAAAIPLISTGIGVVGGMFGKKKAQQGMQAPLIGQQQLASQTAALGTPLMGRAASYYDTLLRGSRSDLAMATAPERAAVTDVYRGAERNLERSGVRGANRDVAKAELGREQASRIAGLTTGVRPGAAAALNQIGQFNTGQAGSLYGQILHGQRQDRAYNDEQSKGMWSNIGQLLVGGYGAYKGWKAGQGTPGSISTNIGGYSA